MAKIRIDKYLADMGLGTRSEVKAYIKAGRVEVNDITIKSSDMKIDSQEDKVCFDNREISYVEVEYYMLNKPQGVISASTDKKAKTVIDLIESRNRKDLFCVGRLDKDTEGLLLITNDGELCHNLLAPKKHVDKVYYAHIDGIVTSDTVERFKNGVPLDEATVARPGKLEIISADALNNKSTIRLTIHEGKFHQVKRMFISCGMEVTYLKRLSMGSLTLDESLKPGEYRLLTNEEIISLKELV